MAEPDHEPLFLEIQAFSPTLGTAILAFIALFTFVILVFSPAEALAYVMPWMAVPLILVAALFLTARMRTEVRPGEIAIRMLYVYERRIPLSEVASFAARTYRPIREYGGWGIRWSRNGRAYNMRGDRGVELTITEGRPIMIGSQRPEELASAISAAQSTQ